MGFDKLEQYEITKFYDKLFNECSFFEYYVPQ